MENKISDLYIAQKRPLTKKAMYKTKKTDGARRGEVERRFGGDFDGR